jgi:hypothetical protein
MKKSWYLAAIAAALMICVGGAAYAQERHEHHWDNDHPRFDDHEHVVVNSWWAGHRDHPPVGFRVVDRLPEGWDARLQVGFVLDSGWRARLHPVPHDLLITLPPPPPHYAYWVVGGHVVLVDGGWHVADVIHIEL